MDPVYVIAAVLAVLAVVQSLFGMGILVFGTPTLLLLGLDFTTTLGWLLPASLSISALQVAGGRRLQASGHAPPPRLRILLVATSLLVTLSLVILLQFKASIDLWIGLAMLSAAALRQSAWLKARFRQLVQRSEHAYLVVMGVVHGATNMGGALLALYASSVVDDKHGTRLLIARYYLLFGTVQVAVLLALKRTPVPLESLGLAAMAALIYLGVGNRTFGKFTGSTYEKAFTGFIAAYGVAVLGKSYL